MWLIWREVERLLEVGQTYGVPMTGKAYREVLEVHQALLTFVRAERVEPTSNAAKRATRPRALLRKGRTGTQSPKGSSLAATIITAVAILRQQRRHVLPYVTAACEASSCGATAPSLPLMPASLQHLMHPAVLLNHVSKRLPCHDEMW